MALQQESRLDQLRREFGVQNPSLPSPLDPLDRLRGQFVEANTGIDINRTDTPSLAKLLGSAAVFGTSAAQSAVFIPAALEKIVTSAIEAGVRHEVPGLIETVQKGLSTFEEDIIRSTGLNNPQLVQVAGQIVGGVIGGFGGLISSARLPGVVAQAVLGKRVGGAMLRTMTLPQFALQANRSERFLTALKRTSQTAIEGGFFEISRSNTEEVEARRVLGAVAFGATFGAGFSALSARKAKKVLQDLSIRSGFPQDYPVELMEQFLRGDHSGMPKQVVEYFAARNAEDDILAAAAEFQKNLNDQTIGAVRAAMAEAGEVGASGAARGVRMTANELDELRLAHPTMRFEQVSDDLGDSTLLWGIHPESLSKAIDDDASTSLIRLIGKEPQRTAVGVLDDQAIEFYQRFGYLKRQRALYNGEEVIVEGPTGFGKNQRIKISNMAGATLRPVPLEKLQMIDDAVAKIGSNDSIEMFRNFRDQHVDKSWQETFDQFWDNMIQGHGDPGSLAIFKRPYEQFLIEATADDAIIRMAPPLKAQVDKFQKAYASAMEKLDRGEAGRWSFLEEASAKGHIVTELSAGRVKLTRAGGKMAGQSTQVMNRPMARDYLKNFRVVDALESADFTPDAFGSIPVERLHGVAYTPPPPNPSKPPDFQAAGIQRTYKIGPFAKVFSSLSSMLSFGGALRNAEDAAALFERQGAGEVWSRVVEPVRRDMTFADQAMAPYLKRLSHWITRHNSKKSNRLDVITEYVRSEAKDVFRDSQSMSSLEVSIGDGISKLFDDLFDEWSRATGIRLSKDEWIRNYLPEMQSWTNQSGTLDIENIWQARGKIMPKEVEFAGEFFKEGLIQGDEDAFVLAAKHIRQGFHKIHAGRSWEDALTYTKTLKGDARKFAIEYLAASRGMPEASREAMSSWMQNFGRELGMTIDPVTANSLFDQLSMLNTGALMAFRPAMVARQFTQNFQLLAPLLPKGNTRVLSAMRQLTMGKRAEGLRKWVHDIGAIPEKTPITTAEQFDVLPTAGAKVRQRAADTARKVTNLGLKPFTSADSFQRATAAVAIRDSLENIKPRYEAAQQGVTKVLQRELIEAAGLHMQGLAKQNTFLALLETQGFDAARDFAAREMAAFTNFLYGTVNAPRWVRSAPGRLFGKFATWPAGYLNWVKQVADADIPGSQKAAVLFKHGTVNAAILSAGSAIGLNVMSWTPFGHPVYTGGPLVEVAKDFFTMVNGMNSIITGYEPGPDYALAFSRMPQHLWGFVPGSGLLQTDFRRAIERADQDETALAVLESLGIRTVDPQAGPKTPVLQQLVPSRQAREAPGQFLLGPLGSNEQAPGASPLDVI